MVSMAEPVLAAAESELEARQEKLDRAKIAIVRAEAELLTIPNVGGRYHPWLTL
jgi:hypothetical protein